ncbi:MAG: hypothetical protein Q8N30_00015 [Methylococcales bacterium]|nr:hypothetical protein [Methylococcales bacterium]
MLQAQHEIKGVIGSEKEAFFRDPDTIAALAKAPWNLTVTVETSGSREIATLPNLAKQYDFVFPAGVSAAEKIKRDQNVKKSVQPFFTPMAIASWKPIAEILIANNIVNKRGDAYYIIYMTALFNLIINEKRWTDLKGNGLYPANKSILVATSNVAKSNSAAMYLALASYILNNNAIVQNEAQITPLVPKLASLFTRQGFAENSTEIPFQDYLTMGIGKSPLVMIYEAQFLREQAKIKNSPIRPDMVLLYPEPTLFTKHIFIPFNEDAEKLGRALMEDEELQKIAARHGLRTVNVSAAKDSNFIAPPDLVNVIDAPSYEILEAMINQITASKQ